MSVDIRAKVLLDQEMTRTALWLLQDEVIIHKHLQLWVPRGPLVSG